MEFSEVLVKENPGLCRCCLSEGCYKDLSTNYTWMNDTEVYADMLLECFDISITQQNHGPNGPNRLICEVCITRLRDACNFKKQVLESEKKFVNMVEEMRPKIILFPPNAMKAEIQIEETNPDDDVEYLDEFDFDDEALKNQEVAKESEVLPEPSGSEDITVSTLPVKNKRGRPRKHSVKTEKSSKVKLEDKPRTSKAAAKGDRSNSAGDQTKKMEIARKVAIKRRNVEIVLQNTNVTPFSWYKGKYRCFYCSEPMKDPEILRDHTLKIHQFANIELVILDRTKHSRNKDAAVKIDVTDLSCKICMNFFPDLEQTIHHLIIAHDAEYDTSVPNCLLPFRLGKDRLTCPICNMKFAFFEYLLRHANKHHLAHDYICDVCGSSFQGENHLQMHTRYYHREGGYTCEYCGITLGTLSKKLVHEKNIHLANLLPCPHCPESFKSPYLKKLHLANVHGVEELKIKCPNCPKVFPQESIMSRHMRRVHLREKNVECQVCREKFFSAYDLKLHMVKHNGEKKFVCTVCGKKFSNRSNLNCHSVVHTGERSFVCHICNKTFAHNTNLKLHLKNVHQQYEIIDINTDDVGDIDPELVEMEFIGDDLEGSEITGTYID